VSEVLLQKLIRTSSKKELDQLKTLLPVNPSTNMWREAQPVTEITDPVYPFGTDERRPTKEEVGAISYCSMVHVFMDVYFCV